METHFLITYAWKDFLDSDIAIALANRNTSITIITQRAKREDLKHVGSNLIACIGMSYVIKEDYFHIKKTEMAIINRLKEEK